MRKDLNKCGEFSIAENREFLTAIYNYMHKFCNENIFFLYIGNDFRIAQDTF